MGILFDPLDAVFSSRSKVRLLRALLRTGRLVSGREAARLAGVARVPAARALEELVALGVVNRESASRQHLYSANRASFLVREALEPAFGAEWNRVDAVFQWLRAALQIPAVRVRSAVIFGSAARGEARPESDLDLLVIVDAGSVVASVHDQLVEKSTELDAVFGLRLSPVVLTLERLLEMHAGGAELVGSALADGRVVLGEPLEDMLRG